MPSNLNPLDHPDAEISRSHFCQLTGRSRITAYRLERIDPLWPKPVMRGRRVFYKAVDCKRYLNAGAPRETKISNSPVANATSNRTPT
jgi:hypothetical protein